MTVNRRNVLRGLLLAGAAALMSACVVAPAPYHYAGDPYAEGPYAEVAPPPIQAEVVGVAPYPGWIWLGGYWNWVGGRHVWVAGRWSEPRPGFHYVPHAWVQEGRSWHLHPGRWEPEHHR
jgi:hypothetical protein